MILILILSCNPLQTSEVAWLSHYQWESVVVQYRLQLQLLPQQQLAEGNCLNGHYITEEAEIEDIGLVVPSRKINKVLCQMNS